MRFLTLLSIIFSFSALSADRIEELIEMSSPECKTEVIQFKDGIVVDFDSHMKKVLLDDIEKLLKIRVILINEGAVKSQAEFDDNLAFKLSLLLTNNMIIEEQRESILNIKEALMTYPLKVNEWHINNLKNRFEELGI